MARTGRPKKEFDQRMFENLCVIQCTEKEICYCFGCCEDTLNSWCKRTYKKTFSDIYNEKAVKGRISLRRSQFRLAEKNAAMAIWLGKQYLDQREPLEEQKLEIELIKLESQIKDNQPEILEGEEDSFMYAMNAKASEIWGGEKEDKGQKLETED